MSPTTGKAKKTISYETEDGAKRSFEAILGANPSPEEIQKLVAAHDATERAIHPPQKDDSFWKGIATTGEGIANLGKRLITPPDNTADKVARGVAGPLGPVIMDAGRAAGETFNKAKQSLSQGDIPSAIGYGAATALPGVGPWAAHLGETIGEGRPKEALGEALSSAAAAELGGRFAPPVGKGVVKGIDATPTVLRGAGRGMKEGMSEMGRWHGFPVPAPIANAATGAILGRVIGGAGGAEAGALAGAAYPFVKGAVKGAREGMRQFNLENPGPLPVRDTLWKRDQPLNIGTDANPVPPIPPPASSLPSGRVPGPIPQRPVPDRTPLWKGVTDSGDTSLPPPQVSAPLPQASLPSGRTPGPAPQQPLPAPPARTPLWKGIPDASTQPTPQSAPASTPLLRLPSGRVPGQPTRARMIGGEIIPPDMAPGAPLPSFMQSPPIRPMGYTPGREATELGLPESEVRAMRKGDISTSMTPTWGRKNPVGNLAPEGKAPTKIFPADRIVEFARLNNMDVKTARAQLTGEGYQIK